VIIRRLLLAAAIVAAGLVPASGAVADTLPAPAPTADAAVAPGPVPAPPTAKAAWVGRLLAPVLARRAPRPGAAPAGKLSPVAPFANGPTELMVTRTVVIDGRRWVELLLPKRPNGSRGWVPTDVLRLRKTAMRITIDLGDRRLTVLRAGRRAFTVPVAVGKSATPTPRGSFAIAETIRTNLPDAFLGPYVLPITGFSEKLNEFAGGDGRVAIHGTSLPQLIGTQASNGCIRMLNRDIVRLSRVIRPGTPVTIRA
jgi:lipoprotein-anchoring transpeptidase ErfK/SrfK